MDVALGHFQCVHVAVRDSRVVVAVAGADVVVDG